MNHKTVFDKDFRLDKSDYEYSYQEELTEKLDADHSVFNQERLNEIVLWKLNRYALFTDEVIRALNEISPEGETMDREKTERVLTLLLGTKGVQLPMASTILRFRNPKVYQIIDQRVYRLIYPGEELHLPAYRSEKNISTQIGIYLEYLVRLKKVCTDKGIDYHLADRILFMADRRVNKAHKLRNY